MTKKDFIIAILATFCLTVTLFVVLPTKSSPSAGGYDSWADINDDGKINMYDIGYTAQRYGATGDPTKNVNVTNWPEPQYKTGSQVVNISWYNGGDSGSFKLNTTAIVSTGGYSRMSVAISPLDISISGTWAPKTLTVSLANLLWKDTPKFTELADLVTALYETVDDFNVSVYGKTDFVESERSQAKLFDVKGPYCFCWLSTVWSGNAAPVGHPTGWMTVQISWYLRND